MGAPRVHELKCWPPYFEDVCTGIKTFEVRRDDRDPGIRWDDTLLIREWTLDRGYTGRETKRRVCYILPGGDFGIEDGYIVLGLAPLEVAS